MANTILTQVTHANQVRATHKQVFSLDTGKKSCMRFFPLHRGRFRVSVPACDFFSPLELSLRAKLAGGPGFAFCRRQRLKMLPTTGKGSTNKLNWSAASRTYRIKDGDWVGVDACQLLFPWSRCDVCGPNNS
eukprot:INCI1711.1.p1 GENE.INCI1711.1~~INCI1711.1.p1  ORF type:complete len:132 (-),score=9.23 INCI1711.1:59-454(-)